jgi:TRAP-type C4-dicarboxylate transport system permease small subunit
MKLLQTLGKVETGVKKVLGSIVFLLFALMTVLVFAQVFTRFFTNSSLTWSEELSRFTLVWLIYMASILAYGDKIHIAVDALTMLLKGTLGKVVKCVNRLCVFTFVVLITLGAVEFIPMTAMQQSPANGIVMAHVYFAIPVSMVFIGIITVKEVYLILLGLDDSKETEATR